MLLESYFEEDYIFSILFIVLFCNIAVEKRVFGRGSTLDCTFMERKEERKEQRIEDFTGNRTHEQRKQGQRPNHYTMETTSRFVFIFIGFIQHSRIWLINRKFIILFLVLFYVMGKKLSNKLRLSSTKITQNLRKMSPWGSFTKDN